MKKIAILKSSSSQKGGLEKHAAFIASAFHERGDQVQILTTGSFEKKAPYPIASIDPIPWPGFLRLRQFDTFVQNFLKKEPMDIVFGMDRNRFQTHLRAGNGVHAAYLQSRLRIEGNLRAFFHRINPLHRTVLDLEKKAFENPSLVKLFTNSHMVKCQILTHYDVEEKKIEVIHNGVEWEEREKDFLLSEEKKKAFFQAHHLCPDHFHLLFIGNGYRRKGLLELLYALSKIRRVPFYLSVVGKDKNLPFYREKIERFGLQDRVRFFGPQPTILPFYQMADCLVIPSHYDPFANVTIEALAMGLFVVTSKHNGGMEVIDEENGAIIEDLSSTSSFISALEKAFKTPKTKISSRKIRATVKGLEMKNQLKTLLDFCE